MRVIVGGSNGGGTSTGTGSTGSGVIIPPTSDADLLEIEEFINGLLTEMGVQSVGNSDGVEINEALIGFYFYWKRERLMTKYEGTNTYSPFRRFQNSLTQAQTTTLNISTTRIENLKQQTKYQTGIWKEILALIDISIKYELESRDTVVQMDEAEAQADLILYYGEIGLDISGFQSIGGGIGSVATYWVGYINNDTYLEAEAQAHLQEDLVLIVQELNPSKKFKKLQALGETISKINKILFKIKKTQLDGIIIFTSDKIGDPLYSGSNGKWVKKAYYDTEVGKDFHWMEKIDNVGGSPIGTRTQIKVK